MKSSQQNTQLNMIVSCWPSAGGTTMALMLANFLDLRYIYAGGALKEWALRMGYDPKTTAIKDWENTFGENFDKVWETYIEAKLSSETNFLCEGKTTGFLLPGEDIFEVYVIADSDVRSMRASGDKRTESIIDRDLLLQERWLRLFDVDILNLEQIKANYDFILDNTKLSISESLHNVLAELNKWLTQRDEKLDHGVSETVIQDFETKYWTDEKAGHNGKERLKTSLIEKNLYITNEMIFEDWAKNYQHLLKGLPSEMSSVI